MGPVLRARRKKGHWTPAGQRAGSREAWGPFEGRAREAELESQALWVIEGLVDIL